MPNFLRAYRQAGDDPGKPGEPILFVASTAGIKRDGLDLDPNLWYLENYRKNPVFLWVHDYWGRNLPIGQAGVMIENGELRCLVDFDQEDEFARRVESKYRRGFLHAVSVGWDDTEIEGQLRYDLLDISGVPVPGDADALIERQLTGLRSLQQQISAVLDEETPAPDSPQLPDSPASPDSPDSPETRTAAETAETPTEAAAAPSPQDPPANTATQLAGDIVQTIAQELLRLLRAAQPAAAPQPAAPHPGALPPSVDSGLEDHLGELILVEGLRAGAILSKQNKSDLLEAARLIQAVLDRAAASEEEELTTLAETNGNYRQEISAIHQLFNKE